MIFDGLDVRALLRGGSSCVGASLVLSRKVCGLLRGFSGEVVSCGETQAGPVELHEVPARGGACSFQADEKGVWQRVELFSILSKRFQAGSC